MRTTPFFSVVKYDREDLSAGILEKIDLSPTEWRDRDARTIAEVKRTGTAQPFEKEYLRKDGSRVPVLIGIAAFDERRDQGVAFVVDLTERKRVEEDLGRSEAFLAKGQELSSTGTFSWDFETGSFIWSEELYRIFEFELGAPITFEKVATRYHPEDKAIIEGVAEAARNRVMTFDYEHRLLMPNGSVKHVHVVAHGSVTKEESTGILRCRPGYNSAKSRGRSA